MDQITPTGHPAIRFALAITVTFVTASMFAGCSSFESSWNEALEQSSSIAPSAPPAPIAPVAPDGTATIDAIAPAWLGKWHSEPSGHEGQLRCVIKPAVEPSAPPPPGTRRYAFHFHALWGLNFPAEYTIEMAVTQVDGRIEFEGEQDLGALAGGVYQCKGHIAGDQFQATYTSKYDHGTFEMTRATKD